MQQKIEDSLKESMKSKENLNGQKSKLENLIAENKTYRDRITEQDDKIKIFNKAIKGLQGQEAQLEQARGRILSLQEAHKMQVM